MEAEADAASVSVDRHQLGEPQGAAWECGSEGLTLPCKVLANLKDGSVVLPYWQWTRSASGKGLVRLCSQERNEPERDSSIAAPPRDMTLSQYYTELKPPKPRLRTSHQRVTQAARLHATPGTTTSQPRHPRGQPSP
eukprot:1370616-Rhodomonas_salina.5